MSEKTGIQGGPISKPTRLVLNKKDMGVYPSRTKARLAAKKEGGKVKFRRGDLNGDVIIATAEKVTA